MSVFLVVDLKDMTFWRGLLMHGHDVDLSNTELSQARLCRIVADGKSSHGFC